jgi:hypothetical protein
MVKKKRNRRRRILVKILSRVTVCFGFKRIRQIVITREKTSRFGPDVWIAGILPIAKNGESLGIFCPILDLNLE